jgi:hypothetical protein
MIVLFRNFRIKKAEKKLAVINEQLAEFDRVYGEDEDRPVGDAEFNALCLRSFYMQHIESLKTS